MESGKLLRNGIKTIWTPTVYHQNFSNAIDLVFYMTCACIIFHSVVHWWKYSSRL